MKTQRNKEKQLEEYRNTVGLDSLKARNLVKKLDYKEDYYLLMCIAQTYLDESLLEVDGSSRVYLEKRKWRMAERYIIKAFQFNPGHAEVLYTMGRVRAVNGAKDIAIYCFEKIIGHGIKKIAYDENGRGPDFAKELINDARFELYRIYHKDNPTLSSQYLKMYKENLEKGVDTIFKPLKKFLL